MRDDQVLEVLARLSLLHGEKFSPGASRRWSAALLDLDWESAVLAIQTLESEGPRSIEPVAFRALVRAVADDRRRRASGGGARPDDESFRRGLASARAALDRHRGAPPPALDPDEPF